MLFTPTPKSKKCLKNEHPFIRRIREILKGILVPFYCAGTYSAPHHLALKLKDSVTSVNVLPAVNCGSQELNLQELLERMSPAPFGHGRETKFDTAVRNALQLKADSISVEGFDPETSSGLLARIKSQLLPHSSAPLTAELYALNAYVKGGHFKAHKDTLRGENMVGTLVVALPSLFMGGEFVLQHCSGMQVQTRWSQQPGVVPNLTATTLRWIAFFGDVDHCVLPVAAGVRLTLSYALRQSGAVAAPPPSLAVPVAALPLEPTPAQDGAPNTADRSPTLASQDALNPAASSAASGAATPTFVASAPAPQVLSQESALLQCLKAAMCDKKFLPRGGVVIFPCYHMYGQQELFGKGSEMVPLSLAQAGKLKGRDALVAQVALQAGLAVALQPYLTEHCGEGRWTLDQLPDEQTVRKLAGKRVDLDKLAKVLGAEEVMDDYMMVPPEQEEIWIEAPPQIRTSSAKRPRTTTADEPALSHLLKCNYSPDGYFGNEGGETDFYIYVALHVQVPPLGEGGR